MSHFHFLNSGDCRGIEKNNDQQVNSWSNKIIPRGHYKIRLEFLPPHVNRIPVEEFLPSLPPDAQAITWELVAVARKKMPGAHEFIYHNAVAYSVSDSPFERICYVWPQKMGYVNFGFFFGAGLEDPKKLLSGEGRRLRHVKFWSAEEAQNPAFANLISQTWKEVPESIARIHTGRKKSKA